MKKVLVTGISGFIGSHFLDHFLINTTWEIIGIDSFRHKGMAERITDSEHYQKNRGRVSIHTHDLTAPLSDVLKRRIGRVDYIINMASESHVDRSITNPVPFVRNNIDLVMNILEYAREYKPEKFIQISTDEVYGPITDDGHPEWDPIVPSNPYSASKASQECLAISYWRTYGVSVIITNTMNVIGQRQDPEKFVPLCIKKILAGQTIGIHSQGGKIGTRFYLHARNFADAILFILRNVPADLYPGHDRPQRFNIVGKTELNNLELAQKIAKIIGKQLRYELTDVHSTRPGHDLRYGLDGKRLADLGYHFPVSFDESLENTVKWHLDKPNEEWISMK
jgi:dTDP-glucose 4,6-dehydratase